VFGLRNRSEFGKLPAGLREQLDAEVEPVFVYRAAGVRPKS
jgi:hypothetical protein